MRARTVAAALAGALALPASAGAVVGQSRITEPAGPLLALVRDGSAPAVTVRGTTDGGAGDRIDLVCFRAGAAPVTLEAAVPVAAGGGFAATASLAPLAERSCLLRAVPPGSAGDVSTFAPLPLAVSTLATEREADRVIAVRYAAQGLAGAFVFADGRIALAQPVDPADLRPLDPVLAGAAELALTVDGQPALGVFAAAARSRSAPGLPQLELTVGDALTTREPLVRCAGACASFTPVGVRHERAVRVAADGRLALVTDVLSSADGGAHAVSLAYSDAVAPAAPSWWPESPVELVAGVEGAVAALLSDAPFDALAWPAPGQLSARAARSVGPGAPWTVRRAYAIGTARADVRALGRTALDAWSPPSIAITTPAADAFVGSGTVTVAGTATDTVAVTAVTVNGVAATLGPGAEWRARVPLAAGEQTVTAIASDAAGNSARAARSYTVRPGAAATAVSPRRLTLRVTPGRDRSRPYRFEITGRIVLPAGADRAQACVAGRVRVTTTSGATTLSRRATRLKLNCQYRTVLTLRAQRRYPTRRLTISARFEGNRRLAARAARPVRVRIG